MYSNLYILINLVIETRDNLLSQIYDYLNSIEKDKIKILEIYKSLTLNNLNSENHYSFKLINDQSSIDNFSPEIFSKIKQILLMLRIDELIMSDILIYASNEQLENLNYFISQNFYENILSSKSIEDEFLIIITKMLIKHFDILIDNSKYNIFLKTLFRNKDVKDFFNIILIDIIENIENNYNFPITFDFKNINNYINEFKIKKNHHNNGLKLIDKQKVYKNIDEYQVMIDFKDNMLFYSKYLAECYEEDIIDLKEEQKNLQMIEYLDLILKNIIRKNNKNSVINNIKFMSSISNINNSINILATYQRNFFIAINTISQIINKLNENIHLIPNFIKYICKIIEILLIKKDNNIKKITIYKYIGKFFFSSLLSPILISPDYECLIESFLISQQTLNNLAEINNIILKLIDFSIYTIHNKIEYIPFNWFFILDAMPKLITFFDNITKIKLPSYLNGFFENNNNDFNYNFFTENPNQLFHLISITFNAEELLILFDIIKENKEKINQKIFGNDQEKKKTFFQIFNSLERENIIETLEEIKKDEKYEKTFYLITEIVETPLFRKVITISQEDNESFSREKILKDNERNKNNTKIIDLETNLCNLLYNFKSLNKNDFSFNSLTNLKSIIEVIIQYLKNKKNIINDDNSCEEYGKNIIKLMDEIPEEYKENNYQRLLTLIKNNILSSIQIIDFNFLYSFEEGIKYMEQTYNSYQYYKTCLENIESNNVIRKFIQTPYKELNIIFNNNFEFVVPKDEYNTYELECSSILNFIKNFPNLNQKIIDNLHLINQEKEYDLNKKLNEYFKKINNIIFKNQNFNIGKGQGVIYDEIVDYIFTKIYDKIFPKQQCIEDFQIFQQCIKLSWITFDLFSEKKYVLDNLVPSTNKYFGMINRMKSPTKKMKIFEKIFSIIKNTCIFNKIDIEQDEIYNLYIYALIQSQFPNLYTNLTYLKMYSPSSYLKEKWFLNIESSIISIKNFDINNLINKEKFGINEQNFNEYCQKSINGERIILEKVNN